MALQKKGAFPRGGKKPSTSKFGKSSDFPIFGLKSNAKHTNKEKVSVPKDLKTKYIPDLKVSVVQEGMLLLGIVSQVTNKTVQVSLPGETRGIIQLGDVSELYKSLIENMTQVPQLSDIVQVGDVIPVKTVSVHPNNPLILTSDPKAVNHNLSHSLIENGFILVGSVKSKEDHGYVIDFGIQHVNGFLHFDKADRDLIVGQLVRCCVLTCNKSVGLCNIQLSILKEDLQSAVINPNSTLPIYCFIPGFQFKITYDKLLPNGFEVFYKKSNCPKSYIHEDHLLKKFPNLSEIQLGSETVATLLYIQPLVNFLHFKIMPTKPDKWPFEYGKIVRGKVIKAKPSGVYFKVFDGDEKAKCFVPLSRLNNVNKLLDNKAEIMNLYHANKIISKIRLGHVNYMGRYYYGVTDKESIQEKYFSVSDLKCGEIVFCEIISFEETFARLKIGKTIMGNVGFADMTDIPLSNPTTKFKVGDEVKARVLEVAPVTHFVRLTMKPTLIKEENILCDLKNTRKGDCYTGVIHQVMPSKLSVKFFNGISGIVPHRLTPCTDSLLTENYQIGQLVKCTIVSCEKKRLLLSLTSVNANCELEVGSQYQAIVAGKTETGMIIEVLLDETKKCKGYLPAVLLTSHKSLADPFLSVFFPGDKLSVVCLVNNDSFEWPVFGAAEIFNEFYGGKSAEKLQKRLNKDSVLPFLFNNSCPKTNKKFLINIIPEKSNFTVTVAREDVFESNPLTKFQMVYGKIISVHEKAAKVSTKISDVWDKDFDKSLTLLDSYLKTMNAVIAHQKSLEAYSENLFLGCPVKGTVEEVRTKYAVVRTESGDLCLAEGKFTNQQEVEGKVVWIDTKEKIVHLDVKKKLVMEKAENENSSPSKKFIFGKIVHISEEAVVIELKNGKGELAFMPRRRHLNDFVVPECLLEVGEKLTLFVTKKESDYFLGIDKKVIKTQEKVTWTTAQAKLKNSIKPIRLESKTKKKKKESNVNDIEVVNVKLGNENPTNVNEINAVSMELLKVKEEIDSDDETFNCLTNDLPRLEYDDVDIKSENEDDKEKGNFQCGRANEERILLSSSSESEGEEEEVDAEEKSSKLFKVGFNWEVLNNNSLLTGVTRKKDESSEDEDEEKGGRRKRIRQLTASEKREKAKSEEERIRQIEELLMDPNREPQTADDFDRAVLANPDSSALWLKYMAFHIQGTEIEKARAVARRALKAISFREEQEKLNIWIALLNLENMYGNEDSLNKTLGEALQYNDPYKIHLHMLNMYGKGNKFQEMEKLGNFILKKFKDVESMWLDVGSAYFAAGKVESGRNVLQRALKFLPKSQHVLLISKFAQMENKYGYHERAQTLYETILSSFPKRVDVWSVYVDMLVKSNHIELARQVLERATSQSLRPRKMKTLFKKFITFEETHGTPENVEKVRQAAVDYVQTVGAMDD